MNTWQPIETAPKDGSWILVFVQGHPRFTCLRSRIRAARWDMDHNGDNFGWSYDGINLIGTNDMPVTHWMLLPEPPETQP